MFNAQLAEIRFGTGLSQSATLPKNVDDMLDGLVRHDAMAQQFPIERFDQFRPRILAFNAARRGSRKHRGTPKADAFDAERKKLVKSARTAYAGFFRDALLRRVHTETGFRERLAFFWGDHFTAHGKVMIVKWGTSPYVEEAIRPYIAGKFEDLLISAVTHPLMLVYLNQNESVGPASKVGLKRKKGLNENLAREVLELHTLGVDGAYRQDDVRQLAELFTGMGLDQEGRFKFRTSHAEPGSETVLGQRYGGKLARIEDIHAVLRDLANHPTTARHVAFKLAQHFTSDQPDESLVAAMEQAYLENGGELMPVYAAMLGHSASWDPALKNVKWPIDFIGSALRALDIGDTHLNRTREKDLRNILYIPMQIMGQPWEKPGGPDGWPEENNHWITPQFMAARLQWALAAPQMLRRTLPDPREFARSALGDSLPKEVAFAAEAAENRWEAIALVLSSPAFQRR